MFQKVLSPVMSLTYHELNLMRPLMKIFFLMKILHKMLFGDFIRRSSEDSRSHEDFRQRSTKRLKNILGRNVIMKIFWRILMQIFWKFFEEKIKIQNLYKIFLLNEDEGLHWKFSCDLIFRKISKKKDPVFSTGGVHFFWG